MISPSLARRNFHYILIFIPLYIYYFFISLTLRPETFLFSLQRSESYPFPFLRYPFRKQGLITFLLEIRVCNDSSRKVIPFLRRFQEKFWEKKKKEKENKISPRPMFIQPILLGCTYLGPWCFYMRVIF